MFYIVRMTTEDPTLAPWTRTPGRASLSNRSGRFEAGARSVFDDGWGQVEDPAVAATMVSFESAKSAMARNTSPDIGFDRSVNPYRGCEHGCIYCFARPTHAFLGMSPGLDFETRLIARPGIGKVLARELSARRYRVAPLAIGTNTDPYQPIEARLGIMREILGVLRDFRHPVTITTKGTLIERDIAIIAEMAAQGLARVGISVTTLDADLSRTMEPRAPAPARRLATIARLRDAGVPVRLMLAPLIPGLTDHEIEPILQAGAGAGAVSAGWIVLRLPGEVAGLWAEWAARNIPDRAAKVMTRLRDMHGADGYDPTFGRRMTGRGPWADLIAARFSATVRRLGLRLDDPPLDCTQFAVPAAPDAQLSLF